MTLIYVLGLKNNKYYIGRTDKKVEDRFKEHISGFGSEWTNIYEPLEIVETLPNADDYDEDKYTKKYMDLYGINNVRGGSYTSIELPDYQIKALQMELCTSKNKCFNCLGIGHFADQCTAMVDINGIPIVKNHNVWLCDKCEKKFPTELDAENHEKICLVNKKIQRLFAGYSFNKAISPHISDDMCYRCGRCGHWISECYAKYHVRGYPLKY